MNKRLKKKSKVNSMGSESSFTPDIQEDPLFSEDTQEETNPLIEDGGPDLNTDDTWNAEAESDTYPETEIDADPDDFDPVMAPADDGTAEEEEWPDDPEILPDSFSGTSDEPASFPDQAEYNADGSWTPAGPDEDSAGGSDIPADVEKDITGWSGLSADGEEETAGDDEAPADEDVSAGEEPAFTVDDGAYAGTDSENDLVRDPDASDDQSETDPAGSGDQDSDISEEGYSSGDEEESATSPDGAKASQIREKFSSIGELLLSHKKQIGIGIAVVAVIILIIAAVRNGSRVLEEKKKPVEAVTAYLDCVQALNIEGMQSLLLDDDLSALDNTDVGNPTYRSFFRELGSRMSYELKESNIDLNQGTATIEADISYVDAAPIYQETVNDFVLNVIDSALTGTNLSQEETQEKLAELLTQKSASMEEDTFAQASITYPLTCEEGEWKVDALDDMTVLVMSGNCSNIEEEIRNSLTTARTVPAEEEAPADTPSEAEAPPVPEEGTVVQEDNGIASLATPNTIYLENDRFRVVYDSTRLGQDYAGRDCLIFYYTYTNLREEVSSPMIDVKVEAFQNGEKLSEALPDEREAAIDNYFAQVKSDSSVTAAQAFILPDSTNVTVQVSPQGFSGETSTQILQLGTSGEDTEASGDETDAQDEAPYTSGNGEEKADEAVTLQEGTEAGSSTDTASEENAEPEAKAETEAEAEAETETEAETEAETGTDEAAAGNA